MKQDRASCGCPVDLADGTVLHGLDVVCMAPPTEDRTPLVCRNYVTGHYRCTRPAGHTGLCSLTLEDGEVPSDG